MRVSKKRGRLRVPREKHDFNPMDGMANLADVMLVFACGLLMALIANWNVDVSTGTPAPEDPSKYEIEGVEDNDTEALGQGEGLEEMGKVYKDPETGKYYVVEE